MGTSTRVGMYRASDVPGSGTYDHDQHAIRKSGAKWGFGTEQRLKNSASHKNVPGPGNYDIKNMFDNNVEKGLGNSLVPRRPLTGKEGLHNPGPGAYSSAYSQTKRRPPSAKIGTGLRGVKKRSDVPGPGNYSPSASPKQKKAPAWGFGSEIRGPNHDSRRNNPGPGNYD